MGKVFFGRVAEGKGKGKKLGFPTINIELGGKNESGVYTGSVQVDGEKYRAGIFVSPSKKILEAHLVGFSGNLYGKEAKVEIGEKIREVTKFKSDEELKEQIKKDIKYICSRE